MWIGKLKVRMIGGRIAKTGVAVLLTALICQFLQVPPVLAVVTAIVTIEPTAYESIRKGFIRLPASAIGAAISLGLVFFLGVTPYTFALSAILTLFICHNLKLQDGMLVACLTAVVMIPDIGVNYMGDFFTRLGGTFIGLITSTLVNVLLLPPKFTPALEKKLDQLFVMSGDILEELSSSVLQNNTIRPAAPQLEKYQRLRKEIEKSGELAEYQRKEWKFHHASFRELRKFMYLEKRLRILQRISLHLGHLQYIEGDLSFNDEEKRSVWALITSLKKALIAGPHTFDEEHYLLIENLKNQFITHNKNCSPLNTDHYHLFSGTSIALYEFLSLHDTVEDLLKLRKQQEASLPLPPPSSSITKSI
ncbi:aromatic acid exporter family protein [Thalassorhabdus alkalitolerans]|uniref:Aromatic acid exporter family protein n=1 Tax=Thalassorhabdus alkalitolerans TaxID=2282697 RepID=A0ABW0YP72_9BACI